LRNCPEHPAADVDVSGEDPKAEFYSYSLLIEYLLGCNATQQQVVLRGPIYQSEDDDRQVTERAMPARTSIRLDFPDAIAIGHLPEPADPRVHLKTIAASRSANIWFAGEASSDRLAQQTQQLQNFMVLKGLSPVSRPGPFRMLTELSIPITNWAAAGHVRSAHPTRRAPGIAAARAAMTPSPRGGPAPAMSCNPS